MNDIAWLDQRAAGIRVNRKGQPTARAAKSVAETLVERFPGLDRQTLGAVLMTIGALQTDAWTQIEAQGAMPVEILPALLCLTETAGEYLYAPETGSPE